MSISNVKTDADYIASAQFKEALSCGDEFALQRLFDIYSGKLFHYINRIVKSKEVSEELVLDLFMKIWSSKEVIGQVQNMDAFLYKMAVNKALDFLKVAAREKKLRQLLIDQMVFNDEHPAADHEFISREYEHALLTTLKQLPPQRQLIFRLSRENKLSHQEIAFQLKISKNTVKNHMVAAIKQLKSAFKIFLFFF
ncbi:RNA polymerase sigma-70 factor [Nubsella zeaxanthinifaciens]|uniref:RNA polymerase sigma-70 factor n=1 Tax=Nubsella zeaxanthinifaciens TaxID=392412 RepID=UPI003CFD88BA